MDLEAVKKAAKAELGDLPGVQGFGLGENSLRIYCSPAACGQLPAEYKGVRVEAVATGEIVAREERAGEGSEERRLQSAEPSG